MWAVEENSGGDRTASTGWSQGRLLERGVFSSRREATSTWGVFGKELIDSRGNDDRVQGHVARKIPSGGRNERRPVWLRIMESGEDIGETFCALWALKGLSFLLAVVEDIQWVWSPGPQGPVSSHWLPRRWAVTRLGNPGFKVYFRNCLSSVCCHWVNVDVLGSGVREESWVYDLAACYHWLKWGSLRGIGLMGEEEVEFGTWSSSCPWESSWRFKKGLELQNERVSEADLGIISR